PTPPALTEVERRAGWQSLTLQGYPHLAVTLTAHEFALGSERRNVGQLQQIHFDPAGVERPTEPLLFSYLNDLIRRQVHEKLVECHKTQPPPRWVRYLSL